MKIEQIELLEIRMPLVHFFETSFGRTTDRRIVLLRARAEGLEGWGEVTCGEMPFYSYETPGTAWHILRDILIPWALEKSWGSPAALAERFRPVRGHNMAKAALENALWDVEAQRKGVPLAELLGGTREEIPCGVSIGIQNSPEQLLEKIRTEVAAGYQRIKVKIRPGWDVEILEIIRKEFPGIRLMADANSAYSLADTAHLKLLDQFDLMMVEQPLGWDDIVDHAQLQRELKTPVCLDESIHSAEDARKAIDLGACGIINIKLGRVGGHSAARRLHDLCLGRRVPVWCGGMLESGIGRAHNIAMSTLPGFVLPGDVSASRRYWSHDIINPEVTVSAKGTIAAPRKPGLGYAPNLARIEKLTARKETFEKSR
ncbi:MAG TPA: o-succinylbenzoate synthase [Terriglobia bacterium]|nr:o-succinylbenzoate synthase [Terriglobia bacterium]